MAESANARHMIKVVELEREMHDAADRLSAAKANYQRAAAAYRAAALGKE